jgi:predicted RNA-binding Zn-ribbon protein involved in translation (DUF1610 family)
VDGEPLEEYIFTRGTESVRRPHLMDDSIATTCSRCGAEIVVMTAGQYLSSTDADLDFTLHAHDRESQLAIRSENGGFVCPNCGKDERLPTRQAKP